MEKDEKVKFWYDVRAVSGSHAEVTVSIAGLSLAMLLILPIFTDDATIFLAKPKVIYALIFFFASLAYGILASFEYSVLSGDARTESDRATAFLGPSVAFGVSIPSLFLGFIYVIDAYLGDNSNVVFAINIMRSFVIISLWAAGVLVSRTIIETLAFVNQNKKWSKDAWYKGRFVSVLMLLYFLATLFPAFRMAGSKLLSFVSASKGYFVFLVALAVISIVYYSLFSYVGLEKRNSQKQVLSKKAANNKWSSDRSIKFFAYFLLAAFNGFVLWTFAAFI